MNPIFIVLVNNLLYVTADAAKAKALGGTCFKVSGEPKTTTLCTISGAASPYTFTASTGVKTGVYPATENAHN